VSDPRRSLPPRPFRRAWASVLVLLLHAMLAASASAQAVEWDYRGLEMTRPGLDSLLAQYEAVIASSVYSDRLREEARSSATRIKERLQDGDFRVGDRIVLQIAGETQRSDTVMVEPGREIVVPGMDRISLAGVLRSELQSHLEHEIARFIRNPIIRTASLIRLSIQGSVGRPGFYVVPATALLDDVIMQAGGPGGDADLEDMQVERNGQVMLTGEELRTALTEGRSVDQLNLRAGDQITIPIKSTRNIWPAVGRYALIILAPLLLGVRIF
jgi:hypothetical protein